MTHTDNLRIVRFCFSDEFSKNIKMIHHHLDGRSVRVFHAYHFTVSRFKLHLKWTLHSVQLTRSWKIYIYGWPHICHMNDYNVLSCLQLIVDTLNLKNLNEYTKTSTSYIASNIEKITKKEWAKEWEWERKSERVREEMRRQQKTKTRPLEKICTAV